MYQLSLKLTALVAAFGAMGVLVRFFTVHFTSRFFPEFPAGTFLVNIVGSFLIGAAFTYLTARTDLSPTWRVMIVSGFLGGFTTFSSFSWELFEYWHEGRILAVMAYGIGSPVLGICAAYLGMLTARIVPV